MTSTDLELLWARIKDRGDTGWPPGKALEYLIARAFELDGADVRYPFSVHISLAPDLASEEIEQIDGMVHAEGLWCLCEAKDTAEPRNVEPIAKLRNQLQRRPAGCVGLVFSVAGFTEPAKLVTHFMASDPILLWTGDDIDWGLRHGFVGALLKKYRFAVETGVRDFALLTEDVK